MAKCRTRWLLVALASLFLWSGTAHGQSPELMDVHRRFGELYDQGRYQEALPFAEKALELGEREFGIDHPTTGTLLNNLAFLHHSQGRYAEAEPLYERSLAILEKALGPEHPDVAQSLENHAILLRATGCGAEADDMEARAQAIRK
jgi:tetratricopeptide (TPR) repeat protein